MKIVRNYDDFDEQEGYKLLPDGTYMFEISEKEDSESKNGDPMIKIVLRCIEEGDYEGSLVWDNILIPDVDSPSSKIIGRTKRFLHAIGEPFQGDFDVDTDNWINKIVEAKISIGEFDGKKKNNVDRYNLLDNDVNTSNNSQVKEEISEGNFPF
jgi:hypothetical protein